MGGPAAARVLRQGASVGLPLSRPAGNKQANKQARRGRPHLPDELFSIIRPLLLGRRAVKTARIATGCHGLCKY